MSSSRPASSSSSSLSPIASSSSPVTTVTPSRAMPTWRATSAAVSPWSPVTTMIRMPAAWQRATASATSGRGGSTGDEAEEAELALGVLALAGTSAVRQAPAREGRGRAARAAQRVARPREHLGASARVERPSSPSAPMHAVAAREHRLGRALGVHGEPPSSPRRPSTSACSAGSKWNSFAALLARRRHRRRRRAPRGARAARPRSGRRELAVAVASSSALLQAATAGRALRAARAGVGGDRRRSRSIVARAASRRDGTHPVLGQRAGLVGADHGRRAERLDRAQPLDERAAAASARTPTASASVIVGSSPSGTLATSRPIAKTTASPSGSPATSVPSGRNASPTDDRDERRSATRRCRTWRSSGLSSSLDALRQRGDAAELGLHAGGEHDAGASPPVQVVPLKTRSLRLEQRAVPCSSSVGAREDRQRLAGERRHVDLERAPSSRASAEMRSPSSSSEDVAGDELAASTTAARVRRGRRSPAAAGTRSSASTARSACAPGRTRSAALRTITATIAPPSDGVPGDQRERRGGQSSSASGWVNCSTSSPRPAPPAAAPSSFGP